MRTKSNALSPSITFLPSLHKIIADTSYALLKTLSNQLPLHGMPVAYAVNESRYPATTPLN
jgi:hypothetical protein